MSSLRNLLGTFCVLFLLCTSTSSQAQSENDQATQEQSGFRAVLSQAHQAHKARKRLLAEELVNDALKKAIEPEQKADALLLKGLIYRSLLSPQKKGSSRKEIERQNIRDYERALRCYSEALELPLVEAQRLAALRGKATTHDKLRQRQAAYSVREEMLVNSALTADERGTLLAKLVKGAPNREKALRYEEQLLASDSRSLDQKVDTLLSRASILRGKRENDEAQSLYERILSLDGLSRPDRLNCLTYLAGISADRERPREALGWIRKLVAVEASNSEKALRIARVGRKLVSRKALKEADQMAEIVSRYAELEGGAQERVLIFLGENAAANGRLELFRTYFQKLPYSVDGWMARFKAVKKMGNPKERTELLVSGLTRFHEKAKALRRSPKTGPRFPSKKSKEVFFAKGLTNSSSWDLGRFERLAKNLRLYSEITLIEWKKDPTRKADSIKILDVLQKMVSPDSKDGRRYEKLRRKIEAL